MLLSEELIEQIDELSHEKSINLLDKLGNLKKEIINFGSQIFEEKKPEFKIVDSFLEDFLNKSEAVFLNKEKKNPVKRAFSRKETQISSAEEFYEENKISNNNLQILKNQRSPVSVNKKRSTRTDSRSCSKEMESIPGKSGLKKEPSRRKLFQKNNLDVNYYR